MREKIAPPHNGLVGDLYGLQFGSRLANHNLHKIIITLDPTRASIKAAIREKAHLIIAHHGLIKNSVKYFNDLIIDRLKLLSLNQIDLFVMHTAWDAAPGGISESYGLMTGLSIIEPFFIKDRNGTRKPIGRIGVSNPNNYTLKDIAENLKRNTGCKHIQVIGDLNSLINKAAIIGGKGLSTDYILDIKRKGIDTFITGEVSYSEMVFAREIGLNLIATSHYHSERVGMINLQKILSLEFPLDEFIYVDSEDPVNFV